MYILYWGIIMDAININSIIEFISNEFPTEVEDVCSAIDLLAEAIDELNHKIEKVRNQKYEAKKYKDKFDLYRQKSLDLQDVIEILNGFVENLAPDFDDTLDTYDIDDNINKLLNTSDGSKQQESLLKKLNIPNYKDVKFNADTTIPHTLYENFTYKRPCLFEIQGTKIEISQWKEWLLKTCEYLYNLNGEDTFEEKILKSDEMNGRTRKYFSRNKDEVQSAQQIGETGIYVIGSMSANDIRTLVIKLLGKYRIPKRNCFIYLQRDLSSIHSTDQIVQQLEESIDDTEKQVDSELKIGEYAQLVFSKIFKEHISETELVNMQDRKWSSQILGLSYPLLKKYIENISNKKQIYINGGNRYWKTPVTVNGELYFICSQWHKDPCRIRLDNWLNNRGTDNIKIIKYLKIKHNTYSITLEEEILKSILTSFLNDFTQNTIMNVTRIRSRYENIIIEKTKYRDSPQTVIYCLVGKLTNMSVIELAPNCKKGRYILTDGSKLNEIIDNPSLLSSEIVD